MREPEPMLKAVTSDTKSAIRAGQDLKLGFKVPTHYPFLPFFLMAK